MKLARMPDGSPEIFYTLQGEGRNTGRPSVFIRSSLCNLHCRWCDTAYTWNWEGTDYIHDNGEKYRREEQILDFSIGEIHQFVSRFPCTHFVLTGGEPLIQEAAWTNLMSATTGTFEVETNGTLMPGREFLEQIDQINVSPKLENSGVPTHLRKRPDVLAELAATGKADFKFVVGDRGDFEEIQSLCETTAIPADRVFLMPQANSIPELESNQLFVAQLAQEHGFHYSDRLHIRLFGARRGV